MPEGPSSFLAPGAAHQRAVGQIEDIGRAHILGHGDNLRHQLSQPGTAEAAQQHNGDQSRPDPKISGQHFRMPYRLVLLNSRMLLGPGEKVVAQAYAASCK